MNAVPYTSMLMRLPLLLLLAAALSVAAITLWHWHHLHWYGPFQDLWLYVWLLDARFDMETLRRMLVPLNDAHRVFLVQWLFLADYHLFGGRNGLFVLTALVCQVMVAGLCWRTAIRSGLDRQACLLVSGLAVLFLFSAGQLFNFLYSFDVQWHLSSAFSLLALYLVLHSGRRPLLTGVVVAGLALLAGLSNAAGLLLLPMLPVALWLRGVRWPGVLAAAAVLGLLFVAAIPENHSEPLDTAAMEAYFRSLPRWQLLLLWLDQLWYLWTWLARFLWSPLSRSQPLLAGVLLIIAAGVLLQAACRVRRHGPDRFLAWGLCVAGWSLAVGVAAMHGRNWWPEVAIEERYQTMALLFQLGLCLCLFGLLRGRALAVPLVAALALVLVLPFQQAALEYNRQQSWSVRTAHTAIAWGVFDYDAIWPTLITELLVDDARNYPRQFAARWRAERSGYYRHRDHQYTWPAAPDAGECPGQIAALTPVADSAYAWLHGEVSRGVDRLALVDADGRQLGLGRARYQPGSGPRPWKLVYAHKPQTPLNQPWQLLAHLPGGGHCRLAWVDEALLQTLPVETYVWGPAYWHMRRAALERGE